MSARWTMKLLLSFLSLSSCIIQLTLADVVLDEKIMSLALTSAQLSSLAYEEDPPGEGFDHFGFYDEEPDQAIVADKDGYCYAAFRGTTLTWVDWQQNFELGKEDICVSESLGHKTCCSTRSGFYKAFYTDYAKELEAAVRKCAKTCKNRDECVVFTGHSQGGAIAAVAGLVMADLNPYVITFGQPATIDTPCRLVSSERWYRFVNTKASDVGMAYDPVPFAPGFGAEFTGHMIMLGEDPTGVAYIGLDANDEFGPLNINGFEAHSMIAADVPYPGYADRLKALIANTTGFPIRADGFADNTLCSEDKECLSGKCAREITFSFKRCVGTECTTDEDCASGRCDSGSCLAKLGSCQECNEDSDCAGGTCLMFRCSGESGFMDDNCKCQWDSDCRSGRCELFETGQCEAKLPPGARCNENSDCDSEVCTWGFKCEAKRADGDFCTSSKECLSGSCSWFHCKATSDLAKTTDAVIAGHQPTRSSGNPQFFLFVLSAMAAVGAVKYGVPMYRRRRDGYEPVATELTV